MMENHTYGALVLFDHLLNSSHLLHHHLHVNSKTFKAYVTSYISYSKTMTCGLTKK
ncbi:hypothetical protein Hanom_Chr15g01349041 [Helianthus anomalus]